MKKKRSKGPLQVIPGIGPSLAQDLRDLGYESVPELKDDDPGLNRANSLVALGVLTCRSVPANLISPPGESWEGNFEMKAEVFIRRSPLFSSSVARLVTNSARSQPRKYR